MKTSQRHDRTVHTAQTRPSMPGSRESKNTATTRKRKVRTFYIKYGSPDASLNLSRQLRGFRIHLQKTSEALNTVQSTPGSWIVST